MSGQASAQGYEPAFVLDLYRRMVRIRQFEETSAALYEKGLLPGFLHSSVGQEAVPVGCAAYLRTDDYITSTHRGHGHVLAKGIDSRRMFAELFGRLEGYNRGKGGSMHIMDFSHGILGANGIVGAGIPIAAGAGLAIQNRASDQVVVSFFGDGAVNTGAFHEGINLAAIFDLPVIFVCENNLYAESTPQRAVTRIPDLTVRAAAYGIPGELVDGNDLFQVLDASRRAIERARAGGGPTLLECRTYRWYGHYIGDPAVYRDAEEVATWKARDPLVAVRRWLTAEGGVDEAAVLQVEQEVAQEMAEAVAFGQNGTVPPAATAFEDVYSQ
jgi:TPP-dependent pyruvate/acetoin dehydrogenase alpha subunit